MKYRVRRQGKELGLFSPEDLQRHRESGELTGSEYVQAEGMPDWQPLDLVLRQGYRVAPPPLPRATPRSGLGPRIVWLLIAIGVAMFILAIVFFNIMVINFRRGYETARESSRAHGGLNRARQDAVAAASKPVSAATNTLTEADIRRRAREFRIRQWLEGYEQRGDRNPAIDSRVVQYLRAWIARNYGNREATNSFSVREETERLAADTNCTDPLVLTVLANNSAAVSNRIHRFELALNSFSTSRHKAYPRLYAGVILAKQLKQQPERVRALDQAALEQLRECFADDSFTPADQQEVADIFVNGWGVDFFKRNGDAVCRIAREAGPSYQWLALVLDGERHITEAWKARGGGWASGVSRDGWQRFHEHLAEAQTALQQAYDLEPRYPLAPCRMIYVALGNSGITEMRVWFDRTLAAQIDCPRAWSEMRWGLRPRWYGNQEAMLALGKTAMDTGRFDTDVPRKFFDCVTDVESEMELAKGQHIYGRDDVWSEFQRLYPGYIAEPTESSRRDSWRTSYAVVAYLGGHYDVARQQLEALNWQLYPPNPTGWGVDLSLMPLEVAARTGPLAKEVAAAEVLFQNTNVVGASQQYTILNTATNADARTREFIQRRLRTLANLQISGDFKLRLSPPPPPPPEAPAD